MGAKTKKWLDLVKLFGPIILAQVKPEFAPIANEITEAIATAETIKGASGAEKLKAVQSIADNAADSINLAKGKTIVNKDDLHAGIASGVATVVSGVNLVHRAQESDIPAK